MTNCITTKEIELLFAKIIGKLKEENIEKFCFDYDKYWIILTDEWKNFSIAPEPAVGSLNDDIRFLKLVVSNEVNPSYLELERIASVLRAVSEELTTD